MDGGTDALLIPVAACSTRRWKGMPALAYWSTFTIRSVVSEPGDTTSTTGSTCSIGWA